MGRYNNLEEIVNEDNITRKRLMYKIDIDDTTEYTVISNPERKVFSLERLADNHYGDPRLWWIIAKANDVKHPFNFNESSIKIPKDVSNILSSIS